MNTLTEPRSHMHLEASQAKLTLWAVPIGRFFYSLIFVLSGFNHFNSGSVSYAASQGISFADILVPVSGVFAIIGGLSVMLGYHTRLGALLLLLFLIPVTVLMHNFWAITDPAAAQMQMIQFMKNLSLIGAAIIFAFYGAGPLSVDNKIARSSRRV